MLSKTKQKQNRRIRRHRRVRGKVFGTKDCPRLCVYRSNTHFYAQLIDDETGATLVSSSDLALKDNKGTASERASRAGEDLASKAEKKGIKKVSFDRGGFSYGGQIADFADAARKSGLEF